jgi:glycosyltransferase involved in cell wall biosynthesis
MNRPLRVGLNLLFLGPRAGGVGRYARELPTALLEAEPETEITVFAARDLPQDVHQERWDSEVRWVRLPLRASSRSLKLAEYTALPLLAAALRLDVLHSPANSGPVLSPGTASVVSLHDLIWLHFANEWNQDPRAQRAMARLVTHSVNHADRIFAVSEAAAEDFQTTLRLPRERIVVIPHGVRRPDVDPVSESKLRDQLGLVGARVLLCVAQKRRYKNLERLIRALPSLDPDVVLVLPGSRTSYEDELRRQARDLDIADRVRFPNWLSESELAGLYDLCEVFALPSLTEGFGLPVLEAMAHRAPVACSDIAALREVADDAAVFFDPCDQDAVNRCLCRLFSSGELREDLVSRGQRRVERFSWAKTGAATLHGYRQAIAARH